MTKAELLEMLEVERYAPVEVRPTEEYAPVTHEEGLRNQRVLAAALTLSAQRKTAGKGGKMQASPNGAANTSPGSNRPTRTTEQRG